ncbi:hypothetical protein BJV74DRAFT_770865 [Russula compacta]|nr:hypothetical protein BJV74DRAFT_770865 [Russula compacta]
MPPAPVPASVTLIFSLLTFRAVLAQTYTATYFPSNTLPAQSEQGQSGSNHCGPAFNQTSRCQNAYINSLEDFCLFAPPIAYPDFLLNLTNHHRFYLMPQPGYGTRVIPDGTITGAHFVKTPDYVQVTGVGDLTKINIPAGDEGGELDPHGADGKGDPIGGLVFSNAFTGPGQFVQLHEWTNFVFATGFCFRGCKDGPNAPTLCQHIYDVMGCSWNMPGNYGPGFDQCLGDDGEPMGVYGPSTFYQGEPTTPPAHPAPATSSCTTMSTISNRLLVPGVSPQPFSYVSVPSSLYLSSLPPTRVVVPLPFLFCCSPVLYMYWYPHARAYLPLYGSRQQSRPAA